MVNWVRGCLGSSIDASLEAWIPSGRRGLKILIVQIGVIGDMVLTTPMFRAVAETLPEAEICVLASRRAAPVVQDNPRLSRVYGFRNNPLTWPLLILRLRRQRFDWWVDPKDHRSRTSAFFARVCGAKHRLGYNHPSRAPAAIGIPSWRDNALFHAVDRNLQVLAPLGVAGPQQRRPELFPHAGLSTKVRGQLPAVGSRTVLLNLSAGMALRRWRIDKWAQVAEACLDRGCQALLTCGPADRAIAKDLARRQPRCVLIDSACIREIIALMPAVDLVITPDTSVVHIASAFNVPIVALFAPGERNLTKFRPLSEQAIVLQPRNQRRVESIDPTEVIAAMDSLLGAAGTCA